MPTRARLSLALIVAAFLLHQAAQLAITPLNEGLDFVGHLAYIAFFAEEGRPPRPDEVSYPWWIARLEATVPGPDHTDGTRYQAWAALPPQERDARLRDVLGPASNAPYLWPNYESHHAPLYYWLLSGLYRLTGGLPLDLRAYALGLASVAIASTALPAVYRTLRLHVDRRAALLGTLAVAWFPNLLPFVGRIANDTLAFPLMVWSLYLMLRPRRTPATVAVAGAFLATACATKTYALTLMPVYLLRAAIKHDPNGRVAPDWRGALIAVACATFGLAPLLVGNYLATGYVLPLLEIRATASASLGERLRSMLAVNPVWFAAGVTQYFWWTGYWSFVVRGFYYLPLVFPLGLVLVSLSSPERLRRAAGEVWVHLLAVAFFLLGMLWYAGQYRLHAVELGQAGHGGNEGWYLNALIGSVFAVGLVLLRLRWEGRALHSILALCVAFLVAWNLLGRVILLLFWSGQVGPGAALPAGLAGALAAGASALPWGVNPVGSVLPGAVGPAAATVILPLLAALALTGLVVRASLASQPAPASARAQAEPAVRASPAGARTP